MMMVINPCSSFYFTPVTFITCQETNSVSWYKKNQGQEGKRWVASQNNICFHLWNCTHNFDETWPQPSSPVIYQRLFTALNKNLWVFTFFSITYFVGHPFLPVVPELYFPAAPWWVPKGIDPVFMLPLTRSPVALCFRVVRPSVCTCIRPC